MTSPHHTSVYDLWLKALLITLFCYALFDRSFANFYIGEMLLVVGVLLYLQTTRLMLLVSNSVLLLWAAFALWGLCRTVPFLSRYHIDALRDAVLWGYGVYAVMIVAFVNRRAQIEAALVAYGRFLRVYLLLAPVLILCSLAFTNAMPKIPWSTDVGILSLKASDVAVHLSACALFWLLFTRSKSRREQREISVFGLLRAGGWMVGATTALIVSRGGFVAMVIPIALVSVLRPARVGLKTVGMTIIGVVLGLLLLESNIVTFSHHGRTFTTDEAISNIGSIVGVGHQTGDQQGTKAFRTLWWAQIVRYTFFGPYRWTGKGFGINLLQSDEPPGIALEDATDRSPHNGSMTVLARMGVPGFVLWVALNAVFAIRLFHAYRRAAAAGSEFWSAVNLWIFCYWLSIVINMSFDVYIEGPQGGIWLWCIIGFGVAAMRIQAHEARQSFRHAPQMAVGVAG